MKKFLVLIVVFTATLAHAGNNASACLKWCAETPIDEWYRHQEEFQHALKDGTLEQLIRAHQNLQPRTVRGNWPYSLLPFARWILEAQPMQHEKEKLAFLAQDPYVVEGCDESLDGRTLLPPTSDN